MRMLATDLDRTLLPNGTWPADDGAIPLFNQLTASHELALVYVTGRNLELTEDAMRQYGVRYPDFLCADVGTTILRRVNDEWHFDEVWADYVQKLNPAWDACGIDAALQDLEGLGEQEPKHQGRFKKSYYVDHSRSDDILEAVTRRLASQFNETLVYSVDPRKGCGLLDCLPKHATKRTSLEYLCDSLGVPSADAVFCGDSGNDILPLTGGFCGVAVRNADAQLRRHLARAIHDSPALRVYFAQGGFKGLNGYYAGGVIEGCYHYGLFRD